MVAAGKMTVRWDEEMEPYRCVCDVWHIRTVAKAVNTQERMERKRSARQADRELHHGKPYAEWEDEYILSTGFSPAELAAHLDRSPNSIRRRRKHLAAR